jgi:molecular chaperone DnaK
MGKSIGIDLGTTNSVMCIMHTEPEILLNRENERLTPSTVAFRRSKKAGDMIIVGKLARDYAKTAGRDYLYSVKRLMGRGYDNPEVQTMLGDPHRRVSYEIVESPNGREDEVKVKLGGRLYDPTDISAMILKKMKDDAEMRIGDTIEAAVITVPAYFSERQRHATREAGLQAGLKVKKIIDEPTAAAIAYGIDQDDDKDRMVLVFDLGGGTFDVSILLMVGGVFSQMDIEGDMWLGGDDFDGLIMQQVIEQTEKEFGLRNLADHVDFMQELRKKAREAKEILSSQESAEIIITGLLQDDEGLPADVEFEITRDEYETLLKPSVEKAMKLVAKAMAEAELDADDIDAVLMVGGSSTIPCFQAALEDHFGKEKVLRGLDPMTCVAQGAGILAKSLGGVFCGACEQENPLDAEVCSKCGADLAAVGRRDQESGEASPAVEAFGRTPQPYGIEISGGRFEAIIPKNSEYPTQDPYIKEFRTTMSDQQIIKIPVLEGFSEKANENDLQGNIWFYDLPPGLPEGTPLEISMALDQDMVFTIGCKIRGTDWSRRATLQHKGWQNPVLDEAMNAHLEIRKKGLTGKEADQLKEQIRGIEEAVESGDEAKARGHIEKIREIEQEQAARAQKGADVVDNWRQTIENIIWLAKDNLERIRKIIQSPDLLAQYDGWARQAEAAMKSNDDIRGKILAGEGLNKLTAVPPVGDLVWGAILSKQPVLDSSLKGRIEQHRQAFFSAVDRLDAMGINSSLEAFRAALKEALAELEKAGGPPPDINVLVTR